MIIFIAVQVEQGFFILWHAKTAKKLVFRWTTMFL